jgi:aerotaxis receptor
MSPTVEASNEEHCFDETDNLLSITDLHGRIIFVNDRFVEVSGYTRNELYGQSHRIVRHPDMPAEVFADMWTTIQAGLPWSAMIKNRRKSGDHYWVRANLSLLEREGKVVGYLSVQTLPEIASMSLSEMQTRNVRGAGDSRSGPRSSTWSRIRTLPALFVSMPVWAHLMLACFVCACAMLAML